MISTEPLRRKDGVCLLFSSNLSGSPCLARVVEGSQESIHLNESFGFRHVGTLKEVGRKFGRLLDVHILQKC